MGVVVELCVSIYIHVMGGAPLSAIERFYGIHTTCVRECMGGGYRNRVEGMNKKNSDTKSENRRYAKRKKKYISFRCGATGRMGPKHME